MNTININDDRIEKIYTEVVGDVSANYMEDDLDRPLTDAEIEDIVDLIVNGDEDQEISLEFRVYSNTVLDLTDDDCWSEINDGVKNVINWYLKHKTTEDFIKVSSYEDIKTQGYEVVEDSKTQMDIIFNSNPENHLKKQTRINLNTKSIHLGDYNKLIGFIEKTEE
ncbi:hypothetical protein [Priestia aryabhattai]